MINQPANVQNAAPINRNVPNTVGASGGLRLPRWPLLSALFCIVMMGVGYVLWYTMPCTPVPLLGFLCKADTWPAIVSIMLIWLLFGIGWIGAWCFGAPIQEPRPQRGRVSTLLRSLSDFEALRPLILVIGYVSLFWSMLMLVSDRIQPVLFALALILGFVGIWTRLYSPPQPAAQQSAQGQRNQAIAGVDSPLYRFRSLPIIRRTWPNRP